MLYPAEIILTIAIPGLPVLKCRFECCGRAGLLNPCDRIFPETKEVSRLLGWYSDFRPAECDRI